MIDKIYADFAWEQTEKLLGIDSPSGYTDQAAAWVKEAFSGLGFAAAHLYGLCGFQRTPLQFAELLCRHIVRIVHNRKLIVNAVQGNGDHITGPDVKIVMFRFAVDEDLLLPLQPVHETGGHHHLLPEKRRQPPLPEGRVFQFHVITFHFKFQFIGP